MSEQLALDQTRGDCTAVHLHQRTVAAGAAVVDRAGDQLFAGPGLAKDEHAGIARRYLIDFVQRGAQGRARTDELLEWMLAANLFLQIDVLTHESVAQIAHFFVRQAVVQGDGHGAPHLIEQVSSKLMEGRFSCRHEEKDPKGALAAQQWDCAHGLHAFPLHYVECDGEPLTQFLPR